MAPSVFKKVKLRLNRTKEGTSFQEPGDIPDIDASKVPTPDTASIPVRDAETPPTTYQKAETKPKPSSPTEGGVTTTKDFKIPSKPWLEVTVEPSYNPEPIEFITENSTPQWRWPNTHVRAWLLAVLTNEIKCKPLLALEIVEEEMGIGANLYCRTRLYWTRVLDGEDGEMVYKRLMGMREKEGAVPEICHVRKR
tara:strand:- start:1956 stop:2540 length:585 start_codon:yes stop_codon:yes gene_type:complete